MSTLEGICSPIPGMRGWKYFNEIDDSYLLPGPRDIGDLFEVMVSKIKVTDLF